MAARTPRLGQGGWLRQSKISRSLLSWRRRGGCKENL